MTFVSIALVDECCHCSQSVCHFVSGPGGTVQWEEAVWQLFRSWELLFFGFSWIFKVWDSASGVCLAFSPDLHDHDGLSVNRCPRHVDGRQFCFTPFTASELKQYLQIRKKTYSHELTIPGVVRSETQDRLERPLEWQLERTFWLW